MRTVRLDLHFDLVPSLQAFWPCLQSLLCGPVNLSKKHCMSITRNSHQPFPSSATDPKWTQDCPLTSPASCLQPQNSKAPGSQGGWHPCCQETGKATPTSVYPQLALSFFSTTAGITLGFEKVIPEHRRLRPKVPMLGELTTFCICLSFYTRRSP